MPKLTTSASESNCHAKFVVVPVMRRDAPSREFEKEWRGRWRGSMVKTTAAAA